MLENISVLKSLENLNTYVMCVWFAYWTSKFNEEKEKYLGSVNSRGSKVYTRYIATMLLYNAIQYCVYIRISSLRA